MRFRTVGGPGYSGFSAGLEWAALFPSPRHRGQPSLGIQRLQLVETPAQEPFHDRNSDQRTVIGPLSAADLQPFKVDFVLRPQSDGRPPAHDSSTGHSLLRTPDVL